MSLWFKLFITGLVFLFPGTFIWTEGTSGRVKAFGKLTLIGCALLVILAVLGGVWTS